MEGAIKLPVIKLTQLPRTAKRVIMITFDILLLEFSLWAAFVLQYKSVWPQPMVESSWLFLGTPMIAIPLFIFSGFYHAVHRYVNAKYYSVLALIVTFYVVMFSAIETLVVKDNLPWTFFLQYWMLCLGTVFGGRWLGCNAFTWLLQKENKQIRVVVYGAGEAGAELVDTLMKVHHYAPMAFIDDKAELRGNEVLGINIYSPDKLDELIKKYGIQEVLVAIPSASRHRHKEVMDFLGRYPVKVKTVPPLWDIISGRLSISDIREVEIEDLLGREPVRPDHRLLQKCISGKSVLVTGAGGSIGSELATQIVTLNPIRLVCYEISEVALYEVERKLRRIAQEFGSEDVEIISILGSVVDEKKLRNVLKAFDVQTIYHAAAYKHVPIVEMNPVSGIYNNFFGTWYAAQAAIKAGVESFILVSSDKAVRPTNVMGASKRLAELAIQGVAEQVNRPRFSIVRFGNVLGSSGSIIPLLREQIRQGGPVTVTHPEVIRYFMTIPEAAQLVIQAGALGRQGDLFVLDMGEPVKIIDLVKKMVSLSGLTVRDADNPRGDIDIKITGLRPGEKLYEELLIGGDNIERTNHPRIMRAREAFIPWSELTVLLSQVERYCEQENVEMLRGLLLTYVSGYNPQCNIKDPVWLALKTKQEIHVPVTKVD